MGTLSEMPGTPDRCDRTPAMTKGEHRSAMGRVRAVADPAFPPSPAYREAERPVVEELRAAGFDVADVHDLYQQRLDYRSAVPILLRWLPRVSEPHAQQSIARALTVTMTT